MSGARQNAGRTVDGFYAYIVDENGHVKNRVDLAFEKVEDAAERAKLLVDGHDVELWQRYRRIAICKHKR